MWRSPSGFMHRSLRGSSALMLSSPYLECFLKSESFTPAPERIESQESARRITTNNDDDCKGEFVRFYDTNHRLEFDPTPILLRF